MAVKQVLDEAMKQGDITKAIETHGSDLAPADVTALKSLTASDLASMKTLQTKLAPLGKTHAASDGVVF
jgi:hypothetical protein